MKTIADTFEVSRSSLIDRIAGDAKPRKTYEKYDNEWLMPAIRKLVHKRRIYGYRRITALSNWRNRNSGRPLLNHKRIYRLMRSENLLLHRCTGRRIDRTHDD